MAGGLGFMGAPLNFAAGQALIAMVRRLREHPGELGLVQGNGGHATKHALGVFSTSPPDELVLTRTAESVGDQELRADDDAPATRDRRDHGRVRTVGAHPAVAICRFVDGRGRLWANSSDPAILHGGHRGTRRHLGLGGGWRVQPLISGCAATTRRRFDLG